MLSLDATQQSIMDASAKKVSWLFTCDAASPAYRWSTKTKSYGGNTYENRVIPQSFRGIELRRPMSELNIQAPSELTFDVSNSDDSLTASDFENETLQVDLVVNDWSNETIIATWNFRILRAMEIQKAIRFVCEDFLQQYLIGDYPNTPLLTELAPSDEAQPTDGMCVPVVFGTAYIPLRSLYITSARYYLLGESGPTYTITKVRSPIEWPNTSEWTSGSYTFTQSTESLGGTNYRVFQAIIADSDNDGTADANGLWRQGDRFLDMPTKFSRDDTSGLTSPEEVIEYILEDMGVPSADIDTGAGSSFETAGTTFSGWGLTFNGGFFWKMPRAKALALLLNMCHSTLRITDKVELHVLSKTSQKSLTGADIRKSSHIAPTEFRYFPVIEQSYDSGHVAFAQSDEPQSKLIKALVTAKSGTDNPAGEVLQLPLVQDSQDAQKLGILYYQRKFLVYARGTVPVRDRHVDLQPDDVITISPAAYGGSFTCLIDTLAIQQDLTIKIGYTRFKEALDDWGDLAPGAITPATEDSTGVWTPVVSGPDSPAGTPNAIDGRVRIGQTGNYILLDPSEPIIKLDEGGTDRVLIGDLGVDNYGIRINDASGNQLFKVDGSEALIAGWTIDTTKLSTTNIEIDSANEQITLPNITIDGSNDRISLTGILIDGANNRIRSTNYVSGSQGEGFTLEPDLLEVGNIACRGIFRMAVFQKETLSAVGGNFMVRPADLLDTDMTALDASTLTIEGNESFAVGDILRIKDDTDDEWLEVTNIGSAPTYTVTRDKDGDYGADANPAWTAGATVVNYGQSGDGAILFTSSEVNSPRIDIFTHAGSPWSTITTRLRIGNLNGFLGYSSDLYGIAIGEAQKYLKYDPTNGMRMAGEMEVRGSSKIYGSLEIDATGYIRSKVGASYPYLEFSNSGLQLKDSDTGGTYGTAVYGTDLYGYGALAWIMNTHIGIPWAELKEPENDSSQALASIRLFNRTDDPDGPAEIGDICVVSGELKICTSAGTPGTWTVVGTQT